MAKEKSWLWTNKKGWKKKLSFVINKTWWFNEWKA